MKHFTFRELGPTPDGSERLLAFDMNCIAELELALGDRSIYEILRERAGFNFMRHLLWAGLKRQEPRLTPEAVGDLIQKHVIEKGLNLEVIITPSLEALQKSGVLQAPKEAKPKGEVVDPGKSPSGGAGQKRPAPKAKKAATEEKQLEETPTN